MVSDDGGAATVAAALLIAAVVTMAMTGVWLGGAVIGRHRAQAAADLAALAGAQQLVTGPAAACLRARGVAAAMGAVVAECTAEGLDIVLAVTVPVLRFRAHGVARAGPNG